MAGNEHVNCPFKENERFYNEKIVEFGQQLKEFDLQIKELKDFKSKVIGAAVAVSFTVSFTVSLLTAYLAR